MAYTEQEHLGRLRKQVANALRDVQTQVRWKPGKDVEHLRTRIDYGHLPADAGLDDYETIISDVLNNPASEVYVFVWQDDAYPTVVAEHEGRRWLVMFSLSGIMETAFPPSAPDEYLADPRFQYLGTVQELLS